MTDKLTQDQRLQALDALNRIIKGRLDGAAMVAGLSIDDVAEEAVLAATEWRLAKRAGKGGCA